MHSSYKYVKALQFTDFRAQLEESRRLLSQLGTRLTEQNTSVHPYLKSINALLRAELTAKSAMNYNVPQFSTNEAVGPGKKKETQLRFHATTQKLGCKRKGNVLK